MLDLAIQSFFSTNKIKNLANIQNFGLNLLCKKISSQPDCLKILEKDFGFSFKKYLEISALYPYGIMLWKQKMIKRNKIYQLRQLLSKIANLLFKN